MPRARTSPSSELPEGFVYQSGFLDAEEQDALLRRIAVLEFRPFKFGEFTAKRRTVEYGWEYDFGSRQTAVTHAIPDFLLPLRARAATAAGVLAEDLVEAIVIEYPPGAPMGWHRDVPQFDVVIGISLGSSCRMRLKPYRREGKIVSVTLDPGSLYILRGSARWKFQHSIPAVPGLRYSITFRSLGADLHKGDSAA